MGFRYYVAQINPGQERLAFEELKRVGIVATLLTRKYETAPDAARPWRGQAERSAPLFPGYLFLNMDLEAGVGWRLACSRRGVHAILGPTPEHPMPVPIGIVEELQRRWEAGEYDERLQKVNKPRVQVEQNAVVLEGSHFANKIGECIYSSVSRVDLLIGLMKVSLRPDQVAVVA